MNRKRWVLFGGLLVLTASAMADLKSDTQTQFNKYCAAVKRKDGKEIEKVLRLNYAPNFEFIPKQGKSVNLSKWIEDEKMQVSMTDKVKSVSLHIDSIKKGKGTATLKVTLNYQGITKLDPKGKPGLMQYIASSDATMVQKDGKWWITEMRELDSKFTFNGKPPGK